MKPAHNQRTLSLNREKRFGSLDAIDHRRMGMRRDKWVKIVELCKQIELCGQRDGCFARVAKLAERMKCSVRSVQRYADAGESLGIVLRQERVNHKGHQSNAWGVDWSAVDAYAEASSPGYAERLAAPAAGSPVSPETVTTPCQVVTTPRQVVTPLIGTSSSSASSEVVLGRPRATGKKRDEEPTPAMLAARRWLAAHGPDDRVPVNAELALEFGGKIGRSPKRADVELAWKLAAIASVLGETWLWSIVGAVRAIGPRNPWAFVQTCAYRGENTGDRDDPADDTGPGKKLLDALMARTPKPPPHWPKQRDGPDFSKRLCVAGYDGSD